MSSREPTREWPPEQDERCPICKVAPEAEHLSRCRFTGVWRERPESGPRRATR
ncbi:hypothetical protein [Micromonospora sp. WMMD712]|uniref:hypothetical protein n=1 Tax=Micromonospora TaxID=1873 RepID=UPI00249ADC5B|nr:hypothetical protein [Micromonospora sp. WMMD712]WFE58556.1 hypothetical protein O7633_17635 [Micromonospora sp. WMMD712]